MRPVRFPWMKHAAIAAVGLMALAPLAVLHAQRPARPPKRPPAAAPARPVAPAAPRAERPVPFMVGETLTYDVSWSTYLTAGTAVMTVKEKKPSFNSTAYYIVAEGRPTPLVSRLYSLYYKLDTLIDSYTLLPQRGSIYSEEGKRHRLRTTQFDRAANKVFFEYKTDTTVKADFPTSTVTQDALSAIYVLRAIPIKAGDRMTMPVSDDGINYKAQFDVAPAERVKTPSGERSAWPVKLSLFDDKNRPIGRNLGIWLSDDGRRLPVKLQADLPVGSFVLLLRDAR
jgi:hypothetical protein